MLARVANKLETVIMKGTSLTEQQRTRILTQSLLTTNLKKLDVNYNGMVDEELRKQAEQVIEDLRVGLNSDSEIG